MTKRPVGRPPELDTDGNPITKALCNVTIPVKLRDFLTRNKINRSKLFTKVVTRMFNKEICPKCYGENIADQKTNYHCKDCSNEFHTVYLAFKACVNDECEHHYNLIKTDDDYNCFQSEFDGSKLIKHGCSRCII